MKKLITSTIALAMLLSNAVTSYASVSLDFLNTSHYNSAYSDVKQISTINFKLNEPIQILDELYQSNEYMTSSAVNIPELISTLFDSTITLESNQIAKKGGKQILADVRMFSDTPIRFNKNLQLNVNQSYDINLDMDLSDEENPLFNYIMSTPFSNKYITVNNDDIAAAESTDFEFDMLYTAMDEDVINNMNTALIDSIYDNAAITGNPLYVKISFSDIGLKKYIADIYSIAYSLYDEQTKEMLEEAVDFNDFAEFAAKVPFFDDEALVMTYELNDDGLIIYSTFELNVKFNIYDILTALELDTEGLYRDTSTINFTISGQNEISYNTAVVTPPEITEDNSLSLSTLMNPYGDYEYEEIELEEYFDSFPSFIIDEHFVSDERHLIGLREILENVGYAVYYDNGVITALSNSKFTEYKEISFTVNDTKIIADNIEIKLSTAPFIIDGITYVTLSDAQEIINSTIDSYTYYPLTKDGWCYMQRNAVYSDFETEQV